ncbi:hypothetical protein OSTOST_11250, partial [Ostertagia ostertagi]
MHQATEPVSGVFMLTKCMKKPIQRKVQDQSSEDWSDNESQRKVYGAALLCVQLVVPLTIIVVSYTAISLRIGQ